MIVLRENLPAFCGQNKDDFSFSEDIVLLFSHPLAKCAPNVTDIFLQGGADFTVTQKSSLLCPPAIFHPAVGILFVV